MAYLARQKLAITNAAKQQGSDDASIASSSNVGPMITMMSDGVPTSLILRIDETVKEYSSQFDVLMNMLKDEVSLSKILVSLFHIFTLNRNILG